MVVPALKRLPARHKSISSSQGQQEDRAGCSIPAPQTWPSLGRGQEVGILDKRKQVLSSPCKREFEDTQKDTCLWLCHKHRLWGSDLPAAALFFSRSCCVNPGVHISPRLPKGEKGAIRRMACEAGFLHSAGRGVTPEHPLPQRWKSSPGPAPVIAPGPQVFFKQTVCSCQHVQRLKLMEALESCSYPNGQLSKSMTKSQIHDLLASCLLLWSHP